MPRPTPPAFKATLRTKTVKSEITGTNIANGIEWCFYSVETAERAPLIAKLQQIHEKLVAAEARIAALPL